ncbi:hypothetical protein PLESTB_001648800 [Pleodorina starrii]|uniref:Sister chromatid cohesion protein DCC1 n=1 Tax=Pleodorina starrii TaxID=330485 RepID=A0A9W6BZA6_9CHLO|nr:hypothetical protein PLESTM_000872400 [Pleodorina starrii]GLC60620.1 hypothetical protein PLESTB_001648800 [Pleodorina starrii]GLC68879.1 hypothetical protein PLESTF_000753500 [Pleodorina starrii]
MSTLGLKVGQPRSLAFASGGVRSDLRLLEVDEKLLEEIMRQGVVIKGGEDDEAVLVTSCRTYGMKLVETTNLQLLVGPQDQQQQQPQHGEEGQSFQRGAVGEPGPGATQAAPPLGYGSGLMTQWNYFRSGSAVPEPVAVNATSMSHIELVEVPPRLEALRGLLWQHPYGIEDERDEQVGGRGGQGDAEMEDATASGDGGGGGGGGGGVRGTSSAARGRGYTFEQLLDRVQASPAELRAALAAEGALELGGRWRAVEANYLGSLLELVLLTAEQEGMSLGALRESRLAAALQPDGYYPAVVRHCLGVYGKPAGEAAEAGGSAAAAAPESGSGAWCLDETKVCVHFAVKVMAGRSLPLAEFNAAWARAVPYGMTPCLDMLRAEALIDGSGSEARISPFPASALPRDPGERFGALFRRRARWEWSHLEPYLAGVRVPGQSVEALLMRFARASQPTPDSPLVYSAR